MHWLNFLGQPVLGEVGGSPETTVQQMESECALVPAVVAPLPRRRHPSPRHDWSLGRLSDYCHLSCPALDRR